MSRAALPLIEEMEATVSLLVCKIIAILNERMNASWRIMGEARAVLP